MSIPFDALQLIQEHRGEQIGCGSYSMGELRQRSEVEKTLLVRPPP